VGKRFGIGNGKLCAANKINVLTAEDGGADVGKGPVGAVTKNGVGKDNVACLCVWPHAMDADNVVFLVTII